jgi:hypothetical protein
VNLAMELSLPQLDNRTALSGATGPSFSVSPTISGSNVAGSVLTWNAGSVTGTGTITQTRQWMRDGVAISGATGTTYTTTTANDIGKSITCVTTASNGNAPDATNTSNAISMVDPLSIPFRTVSTRTRVNDSLGTSNKQIKSRTAHFARDAITSLKIKIANWYVNTSSVETGTGGTLDVYASVEYPAGTYTRITWAAATHLVIANLATGLSDDTVLGVAIPAGSQYWINIFGTGSVGIPYNFQCDTGLGEQVTYAASGLTDQTMGTWTGTTNELTLRPSAILSRSTKRSVGIIGNSRDLGQTSTTGQAYDANSDPGEIQRSIGPQAGYVNVSRGGDTLNGMLAGFTRRLALLAECTDIVINAGAADARGGRTLAQIQASCASMLALFDSAQRKYLTNNVPVTASTDSWATTTNQTPFDGAPAEAVRVSVNDWVRTTPAGWDGYFELADPVETSRNSGLWKVDGTAQKYTFDGIHQTTFGYATIFGAAPVSSTLFTGTISDATPDAYSFANITGAALSSTVQSAPVVFRGINAPLPISALTGGSYSINGGSFVSTAGYINDGDSVVLQTTTSGSNSTASNVTGTIGGTAFTWTVTTTRLPFTATQIATPVDSATGATSTTLTLTTAVAAGETIVLFGTTSGAGVTPSVSDSKGNAYAAFTRNDGNNNYCVRAHCLAPVAMAIGDTITFNYTNSVSRSLTAIKLDGTAQYDATTQNQLRSTTATLTARAPTPLVTPQAGALEILMLCESTSAQTYTETAPTTPWTSDMFSNTGRRKVVAHRIVDNATGSNTLTYTPSSGTGTSWSSLVETYKP